MLGIYNQGVIYDMVLALYYYSQATEAFIA
jgi:hypothetical protein